MAKVYKMTENQLALVTGKLKSNPIIDESNGDDSTDLHEIELLRNDVELYFDSDKILAPFNYKSGQITVNGHIYEISFDCTNIMVRYKINLGYRRHGIEDASFEIRNCAINGTVEVIGDDEEFTPYTKEFELVYNETGLVHNSLTGDMILGNEKMTIPPMPNDVTFESEYEPRFHESRFGGLTIKESEINIGTAMAKIIFKY